MLSKEEIEDIENDLRTLHQILWNEHREGTYTIQRTLEYIEQIKTDKQNLIEKLEEDINQITSSKTYDYAGTEWQESWVVEELQEVLEIVKGETDG